MKRLVALVVLISTFSIIQQNYVKALGNGGIIQTAILMQNWKVEDLDSRIAEGTIPISIYLPINDKINLQLSHSPAISRFGDIELSGLSDTWIRGGYALLDEKMMISGGIGLPTGKTGLTSLEDNLSRVLSNNFFKFRLPVFGQGVTVSTGVIYAHSLNEQFAVGGGLNFVYQGKYKHTQYDFDPGDQLGMNIGFDYKFSATTRFNCDFIYTYYMKDKMNDNEIFGAASKIGFKFGFLYGNGKNTLKIDGMYRHAGKNETLDGTTLITESKNSNVKQIELDAFYNIRLSQLFSFEVLLDSRLYMEDENGEGEASIWGVGIKNNIQLTPNLEVSIYFKQLMGEAYFSTEMQKLSGKEFQLGTKIKL